MYENLYKIENSKGVCIGSTVYSRDFIVNTIIT